MVPQLLQPVLQVLQLLQQLLRRLKTRKLRVRPVLQQSSLQQVLQPVLQEPQQLVAEPQPTQSLVAGVYAV